MDLRLDITDLEDLSQTKNELIKAEFAKLATQFLRAGNTVRIERRYVNVPADQLRSFTSVEDFERFFAEQFA